MNLTAASRGRARTGAVQKLGWRVALAIYSTSFISRLVKPKSWVNGWQVTHYGHHNRRPEDH